MGPDVLVKIFDGDIERPEDHPTARVYDKANSMLYDFLSLCIDTDTQEGDLLMHKVVKMASS